jgi:hypothetical protein
MERFMKRHQHRIVGTIAGFDRVLFRGNLSSLCYNQGLEIFLTVQKVRFKNFGEYANTLTCQIKAHAEAMAQKHNRPCRYLESSRVSKEEIAREIMQEDGITQGLICVLTCVEPCLTYSIRRDRQTGQLGFKGTERKCLFIYYYYVDRDFGLMHVRLQTWLPFTIQVCINGREWLARQMDRAGISYTQQDNCFTQIEDLAAAQRLMDGLIDHKWGGFLNSLAKKVNPIISPEAGLKLKGYYWTIREGEFATDVMFKDAESLANVYPALIRHAIEQFSTKDVLRFFGRRITSRFNGEISSNLKKRVDGLRVKHWFQENSIKMYDKQGSVLRIETTINNPRRFKVRRKTGWIPLRKGIVDLKRRVELSRSANKRYLEALAVVGEPTPSHRLLDPVSTRVITRGRTYRALQPISPAESKAFEVLLKGEFLIQGCRNADLRTELEPDAETDPISRRKASARIGRLLRLFRVHGLIYKVPKTNYHRITKKGHEIMTTATKFRMTNIALLAT